MKMNKISALTIILITLSVRFSHQQSTLNPLNKECLCDITNQCDYQCCCDLTCDSTLITKWQNYKLCLNDNFGIPFCSKIAQTDVNVLDLHSGLRTIYSVIKRLFCISSVNFVQPEDWFKKTPVQTDLDTELSSLKSIQTQSIFNPSLNSQTQFAVSGLPLKSSNGLCRPSSQLTKNHQKSSSCKIHIVSSTIATDITTKMLSIQKLQASLGVTLKKYTLKTISSGAVVSQNLLTTCTTTTTTICQNVVRKVRIFINQNDGKVVNSISYVIVGPVTIQQSGYLTIDYQYTFVNLQNNVPIFPYEGKIGYEMGSRLNLLYKDTANNYYKIMNPFNLAFRKQDGKCRTTDNDDSDGSFIDFKFGVNQVISCFGLSNLIYSNLRQVFNYVGKYGTSSTKLSQYLSVTGPTNTVQSVQLLIYYVNIGIPQYPQYEISKIQLKPLTSNDGLSYLYIEFVSVQNKFNLYVPPAPTVDAYLPNDFLYPFFVA